MQLSSNGVREIEEALSDLERFTRGVFGSQVVSWDASPIVSNVEKDVNRDRAAALAGTIAKLGRMVTEVGSIGELEYIVVNGKKGQIFVSPINPEYNLVTHTAVNSQIGSMILSLQRAVDRIKKVLEES